MSIIEDWYKSDFVKFNIIKYTFNREFALAYSKATKKYNSIFERNLRLHNTQAIDFFCYKYNLYGRKVNWYYSLAKYTNGVPMRTFTEGDKIVTDEWKKIHWRKMVGYDFVIDIDSKHDASFDYVFLSAQLIKKFLDDKDFKYEVRFSGNGFHFIVPYQYFTAFSLDPYSHRSVYKYLYSVALKLFNHKTEMVDLKVYDSRRLIKLPYSLTYYDHGIYVCAECDLDNFNVKDYNPKTFFEHGTKISH